MLSSLLKSEAECSATSQEIVTFVTYLEKLTRHWCYCSFVFVRQVNQLRPTVESGINGFILLCSSRFQSYFPDFAICLITLLVQQLCKKSYNATTSRFTALPGGGIQNAASLHFCHSMFESDSHLLGLQ